MGVILLSDRSALGTSDEHCAFDLSSGRRLTPVEFQAIPRKPAVEPSPAQPRPKQSSAEPPAVGSRLPQTSQEDRSDVPASAYLPGSG